MGSIFTFILLIVFIVLRLMIVKDKIKLEPDRKKIRIKDMDFLIKLFITLFVVITFIAIGYYIPSSSMFPTFKKGDRIVVCKFVYKFYKPARQDIVVFKIPNQKYEGKDFVKRIVAVGGDTVEITNGRLYINDIPQYEGDYTLETIGYYYPKTEVPEKSLFILGDNRNNSADSHIWGVLPEDKVIGKVFMIYYPFNRIRTFN